MDKKYSDSNSSFEKPRELVKKDEENKKTYIKFMKLMKQKPLLYVGDPLDSVKWAKELVNLFKSLK